MDVREKLVEQLREVAGLTPPICEYQEPKEFELFGKKVTVYCKPFEQFQELLREAADYISHGVTVQDGEDNNVPTKWVSVKDRLPDKSGVVIGFDTQKGIGCYYYHYSLLYSDWKRITHWMPLPQPPKGD